MRATRLLPILLAAVVAACGDTIASEPTPEVRDPRPQLQTGDLRVVAARTAIGWEARIPFTLRNDGRVPIVIENCGGAYGVGLERFDDDWASVWGNVVPACRSAAIVIEPGTTRGDTLRFFAAFPGRNVAPTFSRPARPTATYRLAVPVGVGAEPGVSPLAPFLGRILVSNAFTLELP